MTASTDLLGILERVVMWLGVGSLILIALRALALMVALSRELLVTYKTVLEIKEHLAKAKERERIVLAPLREDLERLNREDWARRGARLHEMPDRLDFIQQSIDALLRSFVRQAEARLEAEQTIAASLDKAARTRKQLSIGLTLTDRVLIGSAMVFALLYISIKVTESLRRF